MDKIGVRGFYLITQTIKDQLLLDENVNTVTTGDLTEIDLSKQTIFPLSHLIVNSVTVQEQVLNINLTLLSMDIVDASKDAAVSDTYQLVGDPSCEPFYDRFENELAGWSATFDVQIPNDIYLC
jgi:hypothetical protein